MTKKLLLVLAILMLASTVMFAQTPGRSYRRRAWVPSAPRSAWAIASGHLRLAQGKAIASAVEGMARIPEPPGDPVAMLIGLAFIESLACTPC